MTAPDLDSSHGRPEHQSIVIRIRPGGDFVCYSCERCFSRRIDVAAAVAKASADVLKAAINGSEIKNI